MPSEIALTVAGLWEANRGQEVRVTLHHPWLGELSPWPPGRPPDGASGQAQRSHVLDSPQKPTLFCLCVHAQDPCSLPLEEGGRAGRGSGLQVLSSGNSTQAAPALQSAGHSVSQAEPRVAEPCGSARWRRDPEFLSPWFWMLQGLSQAEWQPWEWDAATSGGWKMSVSRPDHAMKRGLCPYAQGTNTGLPWSQGWSSAVCTKDRWSGVSGGEREALQLRSGHGPRRPKSLPSVPLLFLQSCNLCCACY